MTVFLASWTHHAFVYKHYLCYTSPLLFLPRESQTHPFRSYLKCCFLRKVFTGLPDEVRLLTQRTIPSHAYSFLFLWVSVFILSQWTPKRGEHTPREREYENFNFYLVLPFYFQFFSLFKNLYNRLVERYIYHLQIIKYSFWGCMLKNVYWQRCEI